MLGNYKMMFATHMYKESGAYEEHFNELFSNAKLSGSEDTILVLTNNDTFYSGVYFDLSDDPQIIQVPAIIDIIPSK